MPPQPPKTRDASVASLLRRAHGRNMADASVVLSPQALLAVRPVAVKLLTLTAPQRMIQQIYGTQALDHPQNTAHDPLMTEDYLEDCKAGCNAEGLNVEQRLSELYELRDEHGPDPICISTAEQQYLRLLHESIVSCIASQTISSISEPHAADSRGSHPAAFEALLTLSVKPTALAREVAFTLLHDATQAVSTWSAISTSHANAHSHAAVNPLTRLFALCDDMLTKSVAVASTSTSSAHSSDSSMRSPHYSWMVAATQCLIASLKLRRGSYRQDRLVRLEASTMSFLLRTAFSFTTASAHEVELQDQILEIVICALYAQHEAKSSHASRKSLVPVPDHSDFPISVADLDKVGGIDLLLAIFYSTRSESSRRMVFVVLFDLTLDQLKSAKKREDGDAWAPAYGSVLTCLKNADFAALAAQTPLAFASGRDHVVAKIIHAAVENELLERHVEILWSAMRAMVQIDEYFVHSESLANAIKVASHATRQQPTTNENLADTIVAKAQQLVLSSRIEDRFKGERWLAELLAYGLPGEPGGEHLLVASGAGAGGDPWKRRFASMKAPRSDCAHVRSSGSLSSRHPC